MVSTSYGLPFRVSARKEREMSGEAVERICRLAREPSSSYRDCMTGVEPKSLALAFRKYDLRGYGLLDKRSFALALLEVGADSSLIEAAFENLDVSRRGLCDAELAWRLCAYWQTSGAASIEEEEHEQHYEEQWLVTSRSEAVRRACERLDVHGAGYVGESELRIALADAGLPSSDAVLRRLLTDGVYVYDIPKPRDVGHVGRAYWRLRHRLRSPCEYNALFETLATAIVISTADRASLWRGLTGCADRVSMGDMDAFFDKWKPNDPRRSSHATSKRLTAPFARDDDESATAYNLMWRRALRPTPRSVRDESSPEELPRPDDKVLPDAEKTREPFSPLEPPYWTADAPDVIVAPPPRSACPFHTEYDQPEQYNKLPSTELLPSLVLKLRDTARANEPRVLAAAIRAVGDCSQGLHRGELQSFAQHLGVQFNNGELERLCRWLDDLEPANQLLAILDMSEPSDRAQDDDDNELRDTDAQARMTQSGDFTSDKQQEENLPDEEPLPQVAPIPEPETPRGDTIVAPRPPVEMAPPLIPERVPSPPAELPHPLPLERAPSPTEELPHPLLSERSMSPPALPPPPRSPPRLLTEDDARASLATKLAAAPALANHKGRATRLKHAFRRRAATTCPLLVTGRGADNQGSNVESGTTREDIIGVLRAVGVEITARELEVLVSDAQQGDEMSTLQLPAILSQLVSLSNFQSAHHKAP